MADKNEDLRVSRTKEAIRDALVELIEEKGFEGITVKDITSRAKINRGTFYSHYQDKYDLMIKCQEDVMNEMTERIVKKVPTVLADLDSHKSDTNPFTILVSFFDYLNHNKGFMRAVLGPKGDLSFQTRLKDFMLKALFDRDKNPILKAENLLVPPEYLVAYIGSAHIGVIQQWLNHDRGESPQEMARIIATMTINGPLFAAGVKK